MLCRSSVISSTLPHPHLAGVSSLTFSAVAIQLLKDKGTEWGLIRTAQLISPAYLFDSVFPCPAISHPTFPLHITDFHLELLSSLALTVSFKTCMRLTINKQPQTYLRSDCLLYFGAFPGPFVLLSYKKWFVFKNIYLSTRIPTVVDPLSLYEHFSDTLLSREVQQVFRLAIELKQDIEAKMKDKASNGRVEYMGLYFFYSLEGHLHVLLSGQGVCLQKRHIDVINPTAAHGIVPQP